MALSSTRANTLSIIILLIISLVSIVADPIWGRTIQLSKDCNASSNGNGSTTVTSNPAL